MFCYHLPSRLVFISLSSYSEGRSFQFRYKASCLVWELVRFLDRLGKYRNKLRNLAKTASFQIVSNE